MADFTLRPINVILVKASLQELIPPVPPLYLIIHTSSPQACLANRGWLLLPTDRQYLITPSLVSSSGGQKQLPVILLQTSVPQDLVGNCEGSLKKTPFKSGRMFDCRLKAAGGRRKFPILPPGRLKDARIYHQWKDGS